MFYISSKDLKELSIIVLTFSLPFFLILLILDPLIFNYLAFGIKADNITIDEYYSSYHEYSEMEMDDKKK